MNITEAVWGDLGIKSDMGIETRSEINFGYIAEKNFELQGLFPVRVNTPCPQCFLDELKEDDGWCYCPSIKKRRFTLKTNCTMSGVVSQDHGRFMVQCLSFLYGQKFFTLPCESVDSVRLKRDYFGLLISNESLEKGLIYCNELWNERSADDKKKFSKILKRIFGIIHLLFMSTSKKCLPFEKFIYIYIALDACFKHFCETDLISDCNRVSHGQRLKIISELVGVRFSQSITEEHFRNTRNEIFHEGLYLGEPLGYRPQGGKKNLLFAQHFLLRVIFEVLGIKKATGFLPTVDTLNSTCVTIE